MTTLDVTQPLQHCVPRANRLGICDLPDDVLILVFSSLYGQDVARCIPVCRRVSDLIHGNLSLQYSLELAINGMVDGEYNTLPMSDRLQRLRQYSSDFKSGAFHRQDLTAHSDYLRQDREQIPWPRRLIVGPKPSGAITTKADGVDSVLYLSHFIPGSAQGGIPSNRSLFSVRDALRRDLVVEGWAVDDAQDLLVMVEATRTLMPPVVDWVPDVYIHLHTLSDLKIDSTVLTPHSAAALPSIHLHTFDSAKLSIVGRLQTFGSYVMLEIVAEVGVKQWYNFIDVYNWNTGEIVSRTNLGKLNVSVMPLSERYLLVFPFNLWPEHHPDLRIYDFAPSPSLPPQTGESQAAATANVRAGHHVCTLELPPAPPGERVTWSQAKTGDRRAEESTGHFRTDMTRSVVTLSIQYESVKLYRNPYDDGYDAMIGQEDEDEPAYAYTTHLLIPQATLTAQIQAAESASAARQTRMGDDAGVGNADSPTQHAPAPLAPSVTVPWADWGPRGSLRLYQRGAFFNSARVSVPAPFGSRLPFVVESDSGRAESAGTGSVYVFDVNPLVARSTLRAHRDRRGSAAAPTAVVDTEDVEKVLPGVVDPECAAVPYVVYRFPLPYPSPPASSETPPGSPVGPPEIRAVTMSMAGFTVEFDESVEYEKRSQTCIV
ncbi:hypothetical protein GSI_02743 [Ganoderma sinense ZZ0214-1]|uniref:F-box domain-containing protein n=1 Tax=Ganoderma sinense ZZ0214-1 TaxID=1077348 RepID=A0A2G8SMG1_9APHY|nr:hypothetical protein GSI_02743 [Ganoderma sinense ZZ0214-1]